MYTSTCVAATGGRRLMAANEDDRVTKSPRVISVPTPDIQREKGERNEVTPIDPVAKIEQIDQPKQQTEIPLLCCHCSNKLMGCVRLAT